jgi:hypothetical protein
MRIVGRYVRVEACAISCWLNQLAAIRSTAVACAA